MTTHDEYVTHRLSKMQGQAKDVLEALQVLEYKLIPISRDEDGDPAWIVMHKGVGSQPVQVKEKDINSRWMLHVTLEDIHEVEKYAVEQMWGVVDNYRYLSK